MYFGIWKVISANITHCSIFLHFAEIITIFGLKVTLPYLTNAISFFWTKQKFCIKVSSFSKIIVNFFHFCFEVYFFFHSNPLHKSLKKFVIWGSQKICFCNKSWLLSYYLKSQRYMSPKTRNSAETSAKTTVV